jgi:hypothetical protein
MLATANWNEVAMFLTLGTFLMVWAVVILSMVNKRRMAKGAIPSPLPSPPLQYSRVAQMHMVVAVFVVGVLGICAPLPWLLFGNTGLPLVRMGTIGLLLAALYAFVAGAILIAGSRPASGGRPGNDQTRGDETSSQAYLVARITQRFCPRCRAPLAADAPEGLCPACLLAGGLAGAVAEPGANGMAATTPPSGSQPPNPGEWTDLAERLPHLEILELLGRGGMGSVYKARQKHLDRFVALKVIPPEATKDPAFAERFAREARALARLNHANIVTVYDFGQVGDLYYLLMEFVDGVNLRHALGASRLAPREALAIVPQICDALQYAHDQGVVHRDIKPENVLLDRTGRVKIADFGLAKIFGKGPDEFTLTRTQQVMGTPRYMAPEQIEKPTSVDHRADIYSLGVVLYEMLTGELPIGRFQPPSHKVELDVRIDQVVLRTLEKEPQRRYQRASELKTDLASVTAPAWHAPAPATKYVSAMVPGGVPLRQVLGVAIGMVVGAFMMAAGLAFGIYALTTQPMFDGGFWGTMGAAFGCVMGGFGSLAGSYNTYRQLAGAVDVMRAPGVTWFDWSMGGFFGFGLVLLVVGVIASIIEGRPGNVGYGFLLIGGIMSFQAALFLFWRVFLRDTAPSHSMHHTPGAHSWPNSGPGPHSPMNAVGRWLLVMAGVGVVLLACGGVLIALLFPAYYALRSTAAREVSLNNLKQLGLALHNYHDVYHCFPPAVVKDAKGIPLYSGRVLLLPFLDQETLYNSFDLAQAWDSPRNLPISRTALPVFVDPSGTSDSSGRTDYLFVTGKDTLFEDGPRIPMSKVTDGLTNTIAMVEVKGFGVNWSQPRDFDISQPIWLPTGHYRGGNLVLFGDGSVRLLPGNLTPIQIRALATRDGNDPVKLPAQNGQR